MEFTDLKLVEIIGGGTFAEVFRGYWKRWNGEVAIKKGRIDDMEKQVTGRMFCLEYSVISAISLGLQHV